MVKLTDYCGLVSGRKVDKGMLFEIFYGELQGAPMITECPLNMECKLVDSIDLPSNELFIGEIKGAYCGEQFMTNDKPDIKKIDPFVLSMPDNSYWGIGEFVADEQIVPLEHGDADIGLGVRRHDPRPVERDHVPLMPGDATILAGSFARQHEHARADPIPLHVVQVAGQRQLRPVGGCDLSKVHFAPRVAGQRLAVYIHQVGGIGRRSESRTDQ